MNRACPKMDPELLPAQCLKAPNDTLGLEGLVPSSLVCGELPPVYARSETSRAHDALSKRAEMTHTARTEMNKIMAKLRVARGLRYEVPPGADVAYDPGDKSLIWKEKVVNNRIGEWICPFSVNSMRMKLNWLANNRPDCQFETSQMAQVTEERFNTKKSKIIRGLKKATRYATENRISLKVPKLDVSSVRIVGFADASFANNADLSTQLGHICFLMDQNGSSVPINF